MALELLPQYLLENLNVVWTFILLLMRYAGLFLLLPGVTPGASRDLEYRLPAIFVLSCASLSTSAFTPVPENWGLLIQQGTGEFMFGMLLGFLPLLVVSGAQTAGFLSSTTMGLGAGHLLDPTLGIQTVSISRLLGDLVVLLSFFLGVHHYLIHAAAGLGGTILPGSFTLSEATLRLVVERSGDIFAACVLISAPVIVALLLTQFVMGLITKAVPSVNIFIVSFPLTIGIGLVLTALAMPDTLRFAEQELHKIEADVVTITANDLTPSQPK